MQNSLDSIDSTPVFLAERSLDKSNYYILVTPLHVTVPYDIKTRKRGMWKCRAESNFTLLQKPSLMNLRNLLSFLLNNPAN